MQQRHQMSSLLRGSNVAVGTTSLSAGHLSCSSAASATHASNLPPSGHSKRKNVRFFPFVIQFFYLALLLTQPRKSANFVYCENITETTKYVHIKSTTVYAPRRNWDSPNPFLASECSPPPRNRGEGAH
jgi:hypothetical protein